MENTEKNKTSNSWKRIKTDTAVTTRKAVRNESALSKRNTETEFQKAK